MQCSSQPADQEHSRPTTPHTQPLPGITRTWFSLIHFRSPLLAESLLFSLPTGTEMFHFPASLPTRLYIHQAVTTHNCGQVSPFGHPRINAQLTTPRGITQPLTSFISAMCQGIHRVPLHHNKHKQSIMTNRNTHHTTPHKQHHAGCTYKKSHKKY